MVLLSLLTGCGPLPRPFEHESVSPLVADQRALSPLFVQPVDGAPGLAAAVANALVGEEIAASTNPVVGRDAQQLVGKIRSEDGAVWLTWQIVDEKNRLIGAFRQPWTAPPLPSGRPGPADGADVAATVHAVVDLLRGSDSGVADLEAAPHVLLAGVRTPVDFDGDALARAMCRALALEGMTIVSTAAAFAVEGNLKIGPTVGGQNLVSVDWTVRSADGRELGTVSQASPVPHEKLLGPMAELARDIAGAGAGGIREVIQSRGNR